MAVCMFSTKPFHVTGATPASSRKNRGVGDFDSFGGTPAMKEVSVGRRGGRVMEMFAWEPKVLVRGFVAWFPACLAAAASRESMEVEDWMLAEVIEPDPFLCEVTNDCSPSASEADPSYSSSFCA